MVSHSTNSTSPTSRPLFHVKLLLLSGPHTLATFIEYGANTNITDERLAQQLELEKVPSHSSALDGYLLGTITHQTTAVHMLFSGNHHDLHHLLPSTNIPLILGYPWLQHHNPHIDWTTGAILGWFNSCHQVEDISAPQQTIHSGSILDLSGVLSEYHDFQEVFSKAKATSMPPHRPYDCSIELKPCTSPPQCSSVFPYRPGTKSHGCLHK